MRPYQITEIAHPIALEQAETYLSDLATGKAVVVRNVLDCYFRRAPIRDDRGSRLLWNGLFTLARETAEKRIDGAYARVLGSASLLQAPNVLVGQSVGKLKGPIQLGAAKQWLRERFAAASKTFPHGLRTIEDTLVHLGICVSCSATLYFGPGLTFSRAGRAFRAVSLLFNAQDPIVQGRFLSFWLPRWQPDTGQELLAQFAAISMVCNSCRIKCERCGAVLDPSFNVAEVNSLIETKECTTCQGCLLALVPPPKLGRQHLTLLARKLRKGGI